jgi:hypothetical protein
MKHSTSLVAGGIVLAVLVIGAAYMGGRLLAGRRPAGSSRPIEIARDVTTGEGGALSTSESVASVDLERAPELPAVPAEARGVFLRRADRRITIGTLLGSSVSAVGTDSGISIQHDGPEVEVVVNQETKVYRNTTQIPDNPKGPVQQTVAEGSLDEIGQNSLVVVWGKRTGDRIVATTVLYTDPSIANGT